MMRTIVKLTRGTVLAGALSLPMIAGAQASAPIIMIMPYSNTSLGPDKADFSGIEKGAAELLITDVAAGRKFRVVERARLDAIIAEQNLIKSGSVDMESAVKIGKLLGACYMIDGTFMKNGANMTMTAKLTSVETSQIDPNTVRITKKTDDAMALIDEVSARIQSQMKPGGCPAAAPRSATAPATPTQQGATKAPAPPAPAASPAVKAAVDAFAMAIPETEKAKFVATKLDAKTMLLYSKGLDALDSKDKKRAADLFNQVLAKNPGFQPAVDNLKKATS